MAVHLQFEGIRCFAEPQDAVIRPITLLVGENSSGKTTFLALCRIASAIANGFVRSPLFNEGPFWLGAYEQIASQRIGRKAQAKSFSLTIRADSVAGPCSVRAEYVSRGGQAAASIWRLAVGELAIRATNDEDPRAASVLLEGPRGEAQVRAEGSSFDTVVYDVLQAARAISEAGGDTILSRSEFEALGRARQAIRGALLYPPHAFAPVRTSPQRTYDPISLAVSPEGAHVPMLMAFLARTPEDKQWAALQSALKEFGSRSGLFDEIEIIDKGKKESDPFQVGVKSGGRTFNLIDVGYGVSQALPILVDVLRRSSAFGTFLLQQPEVHLHPKAQAELGGFFAVRAKGRNRFIIETHSDYLVDRIRMEVRRKLLKPGDVSLLYFERGKYGATIHNLELDANGSITNPPPGFRQFFLKEERDLLGI
jgi:predicted ATPase